MAAGDSMQLECPACGKVLSATESMVGRIAACPHCAVRMRIPKAGAPANINESDQRETEQAINRVGSFTFTCQRCQSVLEAQAGLAGQAGRCPTCGAVFKVPGVDPRTGLAKGIAEVADDGQLPTPMHAYATAGDRAPKIKRRGDGEQVIECPRCGREAAVDANTCERCGLPFTMEGASSAAGARTAVEQSNSAAVWSLTLGILGVMTYCLPVLGLAAIILGLVGIRRAEAFAPLRPGKSMAIAGMVLGFVSIGLFAVLRIGNF